MQYIALVLGVQSPCTRSTAYMYLQYKVHVLRPGETRSGPSAFQQTGRYGSLPCSSGQQAGAYLLVARMKKIIRKRYAASDSACDSGSASHWGLMASKPPKRSSALTTPISAPPAMNPLAMSVPRSPRSWFSFLSLERVVTNQFTAPPTSSGRFSSRGMNIPRAKGSAGIFAAVRAMAMRAPMP